MKPKEDLAGEPQQQKRHRHPATGAARHVLEPQKNSNHPVTGAAWQVLEPQKNSNQLATYYKRTRPKSKQEEGFNKRKTRKELTDE